jgi:hypothetical protein
MSCSAPPAALDATGHMSRRSWSGLTGFRPENGWNDLWCTPAVIDEPRIPPTMRRFPQAGGKPERLPEVPERALPGSDILAPTQGQSHFYSLLRIRRMCHDTLIFAPRATSQRRLAAPCGATSASSLSHDTAAHFFDAQFRLGQISSSGVFAKFNIQSWLRTRAGIRKPSQRSCSIKMPP